jgi:hypothetical protein
MPTTSSTTNSGNTMDRNTANGNKVTPLDPGRTSDFDRSTTGTTGATTGSVPAANGESGVAARGHE